jgi:DNA modification methylase
MLPINEIYNIDCIKGLKMLDDNSIDCCVTSPPYYNMRDYGIEGQIGLESTPQEYVKKLVKIFEEVRRVLSPEGTLWLNIGDCYAGSCGPGSAVDRKAKKGAEPIKNYSRNGAIGNIKPKDMIGIPWMLAFALRDCGWYLRQDIIWYKRNCMPESVKDRCTKAHEYIFLLTKSRKYYFDNEAILEAATGYDGRKDTRAKGSEKYKENTINAKGGERWRFKNLMYDGQRPNSMHIKRLHGEEYLFPVRNKRSVWDVPTKPLKEAHFAPFPENLITPCVLAGCPPSGIVLDPFMGSGTTALVAMKNGRNFIGFELNKKYVDIARKRLTFAHESFVPNKDRKCISGEG